MQELTKLRGSKYVQSNMNGIFKQVRTLLAGGQKNSVQRYALPDCRAERLFNERLRKFTDG